ncbi:hypothetical protein [Parafilimonas terrae]|jgi:hypothetical protein|uniref:Uncharacterized protein n=1 Tax=Parafilimonas terrae TaxID=1465490 RepID=A0A1I5RKM1_9BACT|nr:hypothetical protein [Parafilimonas terrae]SFP58887.1 hypothetical protein SAMN05444277_101292 [Parafilimonas terrae]
MASKIVAVNGAYDLSEINTIKELREEIELLKVSVKKDEEELEERLRRLPQHAIKSAADNLLPSFINKMIANGTWKLLLNGVNLFANPFSRGFSIKKNIVGSAKKLGLMALIKGAYSYFTTRKTPAGPSFTNAGGEKRVPGSVIPPKTKIKMPKKA